MVQEERLKDLGLFNLEKAKDASQSTLPPCKKGHSEDGLTWAQINRTGSQAGCESPSLETFRIQLGKTLSSLT